MKTWEFIKYNLLYSSNKSYGSHKHRPFKDESHKGSMESLDQEEKKDSSKEDLEHQPGKFMTCIILYILYIQNCSLMPLY